MSRARAKTVGDYLEGQIIAEESALEGVDAYWYDARTSTLLEPTLERPLGSVVLLEAGTPVEIKTCQIWVQNGEGRTRGRWYIKKDTHERLLAERGAYYLGVYEPADSDEPDGEPEIIARIIVPAVVMDDLITTWYESGRSEGLVGKPAWTRVLDPTHAPAGGDRVDG